jgi:hypothetical protein
VGIAPSLGGWLLEIGSWRSVFLVNPPLAVIVILVALRHLPETRDPGATGKLDLIGPLLGFAGLGSITYAIIAGGSGGASPLVATLGIGIGPLALAAFAWWERHTQHPLMPMHIFQSARFNGANLVAFTFYGAVHGFTFMLIIELQTVVGFSPALAGAAVLPIAVVGALLSARSGKLSHDIGPRLQMTTGPLVAGAGILLTLRLDGQATFAGDVLPAMTVFALGLVIMTAPTSAAALAAVPDSYAGAASGVNNTVTRTARLLAIAIATLPALVGLTGNDYADPKTFQTGYQAAVLICVALLVLASLLAFTTMSGERHLLRHPVPRASLPKNTGE